MKRSRIFWPIRSNRTKTCWPRPSLPTPPPFRSRRVTAQPLKKCLEEVEKALRTAKLEHSMALETLGADRAAALKAKVAELSEAIVKTEE